MLPSCGSAEIVEDVGNNVVLAPFYKHAELEGHLDESKFLQDLNTFRLN